MKKEEDNEIAKFHKRKRKIKKIILLTLAILFIITGFILLVYYLISNPKHIITYTENSKVKYGVNLKDNSFYKTKYLEGDVDIISNLIKDINVNFEYDINLSEEIEYTYDYKILAITKLKEKSKTNLIYNNEDVKVNKKTQEGKGNKIEIKENFKIDYPAYNEKIQKLLKQYELANTEGELEYIMQLNIIDKATGEKINSKPNAMSIIIPLDRKTIEITINENLKDEKGDIVISQNTEPNSKYYLYIGIACLVIGVLDLLCFFRYVSVTRSAEKMYEDELKKILFDYRSYVQKISTKIAYKSYSVIKVESFIEILGMREEIQAPILMYTEPKELKTRFMIIKDDMLFMYILSSKLIREELIEKKRKKLEKK